MPCESHQNYVNAFECPAAELWEGTLSWFWILKRADRDMTCSMAMEPWKFMKNIFIEHLTMIQSDGSFALKIKSGGLSAGKDVIK